MARIIIEPAPVERAADLARLAREIFTESYVHDDDPEGFADYVATAFSDETVAAQLDDPDISLTWALADGRPIAFMKADGLQPHEHDDHLPSIGEAGGLHVHRLYVRRTHQGAGLGRRLMDQAGQIAGSAGHSHLWLCVWDQNHAAIGFYERLGFTELGAHPFVIGAQTHRDLAFARPLA